MMFFLQISLLDGLWCDGSSCLKRRLHSCGQSFTKRLPKNEWCGHISTEVDVRCPRCGPVMSRWSNSLIVFLFNECGGMGQTEIENFVFCLPNGFWKSFLLCGNVCLIRVRLLFCDNVNSFGFTLGMKFYGTFGGREIIHCLTKCNGYLEGERKIRVILDALVDMARLRGRMLLSIRTRQLRLLNINSSMDLIGLGK